MYSSQELEVYWSWYDPQYYSFNKRNCLPLDSPTHTAINEIITKLANDFVECSVNGTHFGHSAKITFILNPKDPNIQDEWFEYHFCCYGETPWQALYKTLIKYLIAKKKENW